MTPPDMLNVTLLAARLRWGAYVATRKLGVPGLLAAASAVALLGLHALYLQPEHVRLAAMRDGLAKQFAALPVPAAKAGTGGMTLDQVQQLQSGTQAYALFEILAQNGLERKNATYRSAAEVKGKLRRLTIDIALHGSYLGLREAIRAIAGQPMVRIESVTIERDGIDSADINAALQVSMLGPDT
ncbi:hypothetical protein AB4851_06935 [Burkholderia sp. 22PA0099]|uniref:hypothetical protein n=1 Tax=Burkholderia sp. 22PA0099 TaxID=3237372 RepID=UPI0039C4185A